VGRDVRFEDRVGQGRADVDIDLWDGTDRRVPRADRGLRQDLLDRRLDLRTDELLNRGGVEEQPPLLAGNSRERGAPAAPKRAATTPSASTTSAFLSDVTPSNAS
jgi:hypothetical protein